MQLLQHHIWKCHQHQWQINDLKIYLLLLESKRHGTAHNQFEISGNLCTKIKSHHLTLHPSNKSYHIWLLLKYSQILQGELLVEPV